MTFLLFLWRNLHIAQFAAHPVLIATKLWGWSNERVLILKIMVFAAAGHVRNILKTRSDSNTIFKGPNF
jgi:hypothetical protein